MEQAMWPKTCCSSTGEQGGCDGGLTPAGTAPLTGIITTNSALSVLMFNSLGKSTDPGVPDAVDKLR